MKVLWFDRETKESRFETDRAIASGRFWFFWQLERDFIFDISAVAAASKGLGSRFRHDVRIN